MLPWKTAATFAVALLVAHPARATPLSELAASMEPGTWAELETEGLVPALDQELGIGATGSILPYAEEGVWHAATGRFFFIGSDHIYDGSSPGMRFIAYVEDENRWVVQPAAPFFRGGTMHGYDHMAIYDGRLYHIDLTRGDPLHEYDPAKRAWTNRATFDEGGYNHYGGLEPFPELGGLVYVENGGVYLWSAESNSWSTIDPSVPMGDYHNFAEYNPVHGVMLLGGGNDSGVVHVLGADGVVRPAQEAPFPLLVNNAIVTVDALSGDYIVLGGDGEMWVYDVMVDEWSLQPVPLPASLLVRGPADLAIGGPVDSHGVILFVKHVEIGDSSQAEVWLYKHSPGMGVGRPDGGVPPRTDGGSVGNEDGGVMIPRDGGSSGGGDGGGAPPPGTPTDSGCSCRAARPDAPTGAWLALALLVALTRRSGSPRR